MRHAISLLGGVGVALSAACAGNSAPVEFLPSPEQARQAAYGAWIELRIAGAKQPTEGELLAVSADSVWVLTSQGGVVIPTSTVKEGKLTVYQTSSTTGWVALGVLSTASNGLLLGITAPLWIITGAIASANDGHAAQRRVPELAWAELASFARFPQGMPPGVTLESLRAKVQRVP